ncbi:MAG: pantetheine-phosphate adenylyltransferase [Bdellovibrionales bacterium]
MKAIYPGSFDPITMGHLDIIRRIQPLFARVTVVVANSQRKQYLFSLEERVQLIRANLDNLPGVEIDKCDGLLTDYAEREGARVIVRGLRAISDFEYELAMAAMNRKLKHGIETMIVFTRPEFSFVASHMVKEVAHHGGDLSGLVPPNVIEALTKRLSIKR